MDQAAQAIGYSVIFVLCVGLAVALGTALVGGFRYAIHGPFADGVDLRARIDALTSRIYALEPKNSVATVSMYSPYLSMLNKEGDQMTVNRAGKVIKKKRKAGRP